MKELCAAMAAAFPAIEGAIKDKENPHFRSKYADLTNVIAAIKPALASHGLWFTQVVHNIAGTASVETIIIHSSGETMSCGVTSVPVLKNDAQGYGSALTYARRYSLSSAFGVAPEDDDGNASCEQPRRKIPEQVYAKLNGDEIVSLAKKVVTTIGSDGEFDGPFDEGIMVKFLTEWQKKGKLQPVIDKYLASDRKTLVDTFVRWQNNQAA